MPQPNCLLRRPAPLQNTYTGVSARGGQVTIDAPKGLAQFVDRSAADVRGVKTNGAAGDRGSLSPPPRTPPPAHRNRGRVTTLLLPVEAL